MSCQHSIKYHLCQAACVINGRPFPCPFAGEILCFTESFMSVSNAREFVNCRNCIPRLEFSTILSLVSRPHNGKAEE